MYAQTIVLWHNEHYTFIEHYSVMVNAMKKFGHGRTTIV